MTVILERVKELAISQGTGTADANTRLTTKAEIDQLMQAAVHPDRVEFSEGGRVRAARLAPVAPESADRIAQIRRRVLEGALAL